MTDQTYAEIVDPRVASPGGRNTSAVSWGAIAAGATANAVLTLLLLSFGVGVGLTVISPWGGGPSPTTFKIGIGIYLIVVAMIASAVGGHIAGRLRTRWMGLHTDEIFFRDTAHGFLAWAFAAIVGFAILSAPATLITGGGASGAAQPAQRSAMTATSPGDRYVDHLVRRDTAAPQPASADDATRGELSRYLTGATVPGVVSAQEDRADAVRLIAARSGVSETDADARLDATLMRMKSDLDAARKATSSMALWLTGSLLLGAFASSLAATEGGRVRDRASTTL